MKTKKVWVLGIIASLLLIPTLLNGMTVEEIDKKYSITIESINPDTENYSDNAKMIMQNLEEKKFMPLGFKGDDIEETYRYFSKKFPPKDEFETTEKYIERIKSFSLGEIYAFKDTSISYTFNADQNVLEINPRSLPFPDGSLPLVYRKFLEIKGVKGKSNSYIGTNAFGASAQVAEYSKTLYGIVVPKEWKKYSDVTYRYDDIELKISMLPAKAKQILQNQSKTGIIILCEPCPVRYVNGIGNSELFQSVTFEDGFYSGPPTFDNPTEISYSLKCINVKYVGLLIYNIKTGEIYSYSKE